MVPVRATQVSIVDKIHSAVSSVNSLWDSIPRAIRGVLVVVGSAAFGYAGGLFTDARRFVGTLDATVTEVSQMRSELITITANQLAYRQVTEEQAKAIESLINKVEAYNQNIDRLIEVLTK